MRAIRVNPVALPSAVCLDLPWWIPIRSLNSNFCARGTLTSMSAVSSRPQSAHSYHFQLEPVKSFHLTNLAGNRPRSLLAVFKHARPCTVKGFHAPSAVSELTGSEDVRRGRGSERRGRQCSDRVLSDGGLEVCEIAAARDRVVNEQRSFAWPAPHGTSLNLRRVDCGNPGSTRDK